MPIEEIRQVIFRAVASPEYRDQLFEDADRALAGYDLTDAEAATLRDFTPQNLYNFVGALVAHQVISIQASRRFRVVPRGMTPPPEPGVLPIVLGPELVFGNGIHATTQLSLTALEKHVRPGDAVLDLGTGTGILAMAAAKLGAASVLAVDISDEAVKAARCNVDENGLSGVVRVEQGSLDLALHLPDGISSQQADVVVGNLLAPIILEMIEQGLADTLKPQGVLILSGLLVNQQRRVVQALRQAGMKRIERRQMDNWVVLVARRKTRKLRFVIR